MGKRLIHIQWAQFSFALFIVAGMLAFLLTGQKSTMELGSSKKPSVVHIVHIVVSFSVCPMQKDGSFYCRPPRGTNKFLLKNESLVQGG